MLTRSQESASRAVDAAGTMLNGGILRLLDERGRPLGEARFAVPAFPVATGGMAVASDLDPVSPAAVSGTPATWEAVSADGRRVLAGPVAGHVELDQSWIEAGATVRVSRFIYIEALS